MTKLDTDELDRLRALGPGWAAAIEAVNGAPEAKAETVRATGSSGWDAARAALKDSPIRPY